MRKIFRSVPRDASARAIFRGWRARKTAAPVVCEDCARRRKEPRAVQVDFGNVPDDELVAAIRRAVRKRGGDVDRTFGA